MRPAPHACQVNAGIQQRLGQTRRPCAAPNRSARVADLTCLPSDRLSKRGTPRDTRSREQTEREQTEDLRAKRFTKLFKRMRSRSSGNFDPNLQFSPFQLVPPPTVGRTERGLGVPYLLVMGGFLVSNRLGEQRRLHIAVVTRTHLHHSGSACSLTRCNT